MFGAAALPKFEKEDGIAQPKKVVGHKGIGKELVMGRGLFLEVTVSDNFGIYDPSALQSEMDRDSQVFPVPPGTGLCATKFEK